MRFPKCELTLAILAVLICAATANAGVLVVSAPSCATESLSQPFLRWGDANHYALVPNGAFLSGQAEWSLAGGAAVVAGAEPWHVTSASQSRSLSLPAASSATTAPVCVNVTDPTIRFFARNLGSSVSTLAVSVSFTTSLGVHATLPIGTVISGSSWAPAPADLTLVSALSLTSSTPVRFTFTPVGRSTWEVDDIYLDPFSRS